MEWRRMFNSTYIHASTTIRNPDKITLTHKGLPTKADAQEAATLLDSLIEKAKEKVADVIFVKNNEFEASIVMLKDAWDYEFVFHVILNGYNIYFSEKIDTRDFDINSKESFSSLKEKLSKFLAERIAKEIIRGSSFKLLGENITI